MTNDLEPAPILPPIISKIDPTEFDVTISALLTGLGADKYVDIFRKRNIGQTTLLELTDEDLINLGVDDPVIRQKLLAEVENLPISEECSKPSSKNLSPIEVVEVLEETSQHLYRIYLSMLANTLAVKKTNNISDCLLHKDKYASDTAVATINEITNILNSMDISMHTEMKGVTKQTNKRKKKLLIGTLGTAVIAMLAVLFARSLKQLK